MWIYLLRHGNAEELRPGLDDQDRSLTDEGRKRLRHAGKAWHELVPTPDKILASPLLRARETAELFADAVGFDGQATPTDAIVPHADPKLAVAMLEAELLQRTGSLALVGHEPHLGYLLGTLLTANPRISVPLKKGMLVALETSSPTSLVPGLRFALTQKAAAKLP